MKKHFTYVLLVVAALQFCTWFKPSESFFTPFVLEQFNITESTLIGDIYAWDVLFQLAGTILIALTYLVFGHRVPFLVCSASSIASVSCVLFSSEQWVLLMSQAFWALAFSSLYVLLIALLQLFPRKLFYKAVSINSVSMLVASTVSSFTGFMLLQFSSVAKDQHGRKLTFFVSFGSAVVSFAILCCAISPCVDIFRRRNEHQKLERKRSSQQRHKCPSLLLRVKKMMCNLNLVAWLVLGSIVRGIHTEVVTVWQILSEEIDYSKSKYNAIISMSAYVSAAILVLLPTRKNLENVMNMHLWWLSPLILALSATFLICVSQAPSFASLGIFYVGFHALAELFLAVVTTQLAKLAHTDQTSDSDFSQTFVILLSAKFALSLIVEIVVQLFVWPHWGSYHNMFKLKFDIRQQLLGLGFAIVFAFLLSVLLGVRIFCQQRVQQRQKKVATMSENLLDNPNV